MVSSPPSTSLDPAACSASTCPGTKRRNRWAFSWEQNSERPGFPRRGPRTVRRGFPALRRSRESPSPSPGSATPASRCREADHGYRADARLQRILRVADLKHRLRRTRLQHSSGSTLERHVLTRAQQALRPEIFARISEKLVFHRLSYEHQLEVAESSWGDNWRSWRAGPPTNVGFSRPPFPSSKGIPSKLGARPMRDTVEKQVGDAVAECLLAGRPTDGLLAVDAARFASPSAESLQRGRGRIPDVSTGQNLWGSFCF